jgi:hypothetical protein
VTFVDRGDWFTTTETRVVGVGGQPRLTRSPGRIAPDHEAWIQARKPLAGEFRAGAATVFVVVAHFTSQSRSTPSFGAVQPPVDPDAEKRRTQAALVARFAGEVLAIDANARVVVVGDLNDDWFSPALAAVEAAPLTNAMRELPVAERYSLLFDGQAQLFDHIFVSEALRPGVVADVVHVAAEFAAGLSDHDPVVASVRIDAAGDAPPLYVSDPRPNPFSSRVVMEIETTAGRADAAVFDVRGRLLRSMRPSGSGEVQWDGTDDAGRRLPAGVYWIRVFAGGVQASRKVVLVPGR